MKHNVAWIIETVEFGQIRSGGLPVYTAWQRSHEYPCRISSHLLGTFQAHYGL